MGFMSWKDCVDDETVANMHSEHPNRLKTLYLLQPNGKESIPEDSYDGYGRIQGRSAFAWQGEHNKGIEIVGNDEEDLHNFGLLLEMGSIYKDSKGNLYTDGKKGIPKLNIEGLNCNYIDIHPKFGKTPNELLESGELQDVTLRSILEEKFDDYIFTPIKVTYHKDAKYEDYEASKKCQYQGFGYPHKVIDDALVKKVREDNKKSRERNKSKNKGEEKTQKQ